MEKKKLPFSKAPKDDRNLADIHLGLYDDVIVFDHVEKVYCFFFCINDVTSHQLYPLYVLNLCVYHVSSAPLVVLHCSPFKSLRFSFEPFVTFIFFFNKTIC